MHVATSNISKANICGYRGSEIPGADELGLDPNRIYQLLRDPEELAKAAGTFNNIPLLSEHVPITADDHRPELVVGSTGTDAAFDGPYLRNSLVIWDADAIKGIESGEQRELSCAYRYDVDMTPGEFGGVKFDGTMRNLRGNHVALVPKGRAGADIVVGDRALPQNRVQERPAMAIKPVKKSPLSRRALAVSTALGLGLKPRLAQDAQIDLRPLVEKITAKNWKASKPKLVEALKAATAGKLAQDADLQDVVGMLDMLDEVAEEADMVEAAIADPAPVDVNATVDADPMAKIMEMLAGMLSPEQMAQVKAAMEPEAATDEFPPKKEGEKKDEPPMKDKKDEPPVTKAAMDEALAKAAADTRAATVAQMKATHRALEECKPFIGALDEAPDTAEEIYKIAMDALEIPTEGVPPAAYGALVRQAAKHKADTPAPKPKIAQDAAGAASFLKMFPGAANIRAA